MLTDIITTLKEAFPAFNHILGSKDPTEIPLKEFPFFAYYLQDQKIASAGGSSFEVNTTYLILIGVKLSDWKAAEIKNLKEVVIGASKLLFEKGFTKEPIEVEFIYRQPNVFAVLKFTTAERV